MRHYTPSFNTSKARSKNSLCSYYTSSVSPFSCIGPSFKFRHTCLRNCPAQELSLSQHYRPPPAKWKITQNLFKLFAAETAANKGIHKVNKTKSNSETNITPRKGRLITRGLADEVTSSMLQDCDVMQNQLRPTSRK